MITFLAWSVMYAQAVYWLLIRDDEHDRLVWEACVNPGFKRANWHDLRKRKVY